jgi:hypothetical protein
MAVVVNLNNIFDGHDPDVLQKRMDYAFASDEKDFWERFFLCDGRHQGCDVVYLFTEYQLGILYDYLEKKKASGNITDKEQRATRMLCLNMATLGKNPTEGSVFKNKRVCYVKYERLSEKKYNHSVEQLFFNPSPAEIEEAKKQGKPIKDFFAGGFSGTKEVTEPGEKKYHELFNCVFALTRPGIEGIFGGPAKKENKNGWLHYLAQELHQEGKFKFIGYCKNIDSDCPLVKALWP